MNAIVPRASGPLAPLTASPAPSSAAPKASSSAGGGDSAGRVRGPGSMDTSPRARYIVFDAPGARSLLGARMAPQPFNPNLPAGKGWRTMELTAAEAQGLREARVQIYSDVPVSVGPPIKPQVFLAPQTTSLPRDVHGMTALQKSEAGWDGAGVAVIVIDTGIGDNSDIGPVAKFDDIKTEAPLDPPSDGHGHGTHCSGIATAHGDLAKGGVLGMAPKATLMGVKVLDANGSGTMADVMKGVERAIELASEFNGPVVCSMSLGGPASGNADMTPLNKLINDAIANKGIFFAIAAGNEGPGEGTIGDPGRAKNAFTTGAYDHKRTVDASDDALASFSSRDVKGGTTLPDGCADGVNVRSTLPGNKQAEWSGTSMATPNIAGGVACLLGKAQSLFAAGKLKVDPRELVKNGELIRILQATAVDSPKEPVNHEGAGDVRFDAAAKELIKKYGV